MCGSFRDLPEIEIRHFSKNQIKFVWINVINFFIINLTVILYDTKIEP